MIRFTSKRRVVAASTMVCLACAGLAGVARFAKLDQLDKLDAERERCAQLQADVRAAGSAPAGAARDSEPAWRLSRSPEVVATLQRLQAMGDEAGVAFTKQDAVASERQGVQAFSVVGDGAPDAVAAFLVAVERCRQLVVIEGGTFRPGEAGRVGFELKLTTFFEGGQR